MNGAFHIRAMEWVRTHEQLHTRTLPDDAIPVREGVAHVEAFLVRGRVAATLEVREQAAGPVTAASLEAFLTIARGAQPWIVAEAGIAPDAFATAVKRGVRCLVPDGTRFSPASA